MAHGGAICVCCALAQVIEKPQLRKTAIYKLQLLGRFPKSVPSTGHSVRWVESEPSEV
jgi:predicted DNA-binding transcriptional regulator AlpA